eukprot:CAMPEP_0117067790 /NCGR_PEP_ID=MMETSP0472-20121206/47471_1 /TAXON_ID=693140 ORGANISM="Tiarina fusus, Strain LIS" /NCGR_SAMPLE_ID=MMETSP0472 /ASSEMBLY_ACC=CAM_ASM_000603 /LENGTH=44 /DNA_ID= /DNA_START= /DNA_END= /DNA_ORIENTATION=
MEISIKKDVNNVEVNITDNLILLKLYNQLGVILLGDYVLFVVGD